MNTPTFKHTPGPWHYSKGKVNHFVSTANGDVICKVDGSRIPSIDARQEATARLLTAAPQLLSELKFLVGVAERNGVDPWTLRGCLKVIAEAEGKS